ncbi:sarcosine oxidase subunit gamma [Limimaricola cinnabarinus]|uniref:Sarcosine oxidase gamma subunit n=1 Tax=Limimaricola cinnabarinus LL-001 TaxID=1337093 RepID=U2Z800_9RHOB|nr:sarcosine oxidase subunit gamma family protein [Limimaricola cinnabarinus]GAD57192.1 sarcosine oxidase gamma subunit [Limimaricola cinnabarinus LL-001]
MPPGLCGSRNWPRWRGSRSGARRERGDAGPGARARAAWRGRSDARAGDRTALCLGPDEWLIHAPEAERDAIVEAGAAAYASAPHALVEISDREISYAVSGPAARELLTIACPRDLDRLATGRAMRTVFDTAQVVLWRDGEDAFRLDVWRSFAPHVRALLETGRAEIAAGF